MNSEPKHTGRAVGIALWYEAEILLLFRKKKWNKYIMPGGGVEDGESSLKAARRELREEASLRVRLTEGNIYCNGLSFKTEWTDDFKIFEHVFLVKPQIWYDEDKFSGLLWLDTDDIEMLKNIWPLVMPGAQMYLRHKLGL